MKKIKLQDTKRSYLCVVAFGFIVGLVTELVNLLPHDDLLGASSIAGSFGFWIFTTTLVIHLSCSNKNAMLNTFLYLAFMCCGFYLLQGIIVYFTPNVTVDGVFEWDHFIYWLLASVVCAVTAFVLWFWNKGGALGSILYALPVAGMLIDTVNNCLKFYYSRTQLLQAAMDVVFLVIMLVIFVRKADVKALFIITLAVATVIGYFTVFPKSHNLTTQTTVICELDGREEKFYIKIRDDGKIIEKSGNEEIYDQIGIDSMKSAPEVAHALQEYYESRGGSCRFAD